MMKYLAVLAGALFSFSAVTISGFVVMSAIISFLTWSIWYPPITASGLRGTIVFVVIAAVWWTFNKSPHGGWNEWNKK